MRGEFNGLATRGQWHSHIAMSLSNLTIEDTPGWGQESLQGDDFVRDAIRKEAVIK